MATTNDSMDVLDQLRTERRQFEARIWDIAGYGDDGDARHYAITGGVIHAYADDLNARCRCFVHNSLVWSSIYVVPDDVMVAIDAHREFWAPTQTLRRALAAAGRAADSGLFPLTRMVTEDETGTPGRTYSVVSAAAIELIADAVRGELGLQQPLPLPQPPMDDGEAEAFIRGSYA